MANQPKYDHEKAISQAFEFKGWVRETIKGLLAREIKTREAIILVINGLRIYDSDASRLLTMPARKFQYCDMVFTPSGDSGRVSACDWTDEWGWVYSVSMNDTVLLFAEHQLEPLPR